MPHAPQLRDALTRAKVAKAAKEYRELRANHFVKSGEEASAGELFFNNGEIDLLGESCNMREISRTCLSLPPSEYQMTFQTRMYSAGAKKTSP